MGRRVEIVKKVVFVGLICMFLVLFGIEDTGAYGGKYYIKVNKKTNVATVYNTKTKEPCKAFIVSCGNATPLGTFYTKNKYRWRMLMGDVHGQYSTRITGSILFHSVWYYKSGDKSTLSVKEYNKLGQIASHGCVRLNVEAAKWIYDNCKLGTKVIIFNGSSKKDPLGKPKSIKLDNQKKMDWDPTDPDKKNPYNKISFLGIPTSKTYNQSTKINVLKGVSAKTKGGRNLTSSITVRVKVPGEKVKSSKAKTMKLSKSGTYKVEYTVKDKKTQLSKQCTVTYKVKDIEPPVFEGLPTKEVTIKLGTSVDLLRGVTAKNASGEDLTDDIVVEVKEPGATSYVLVGTGEYEFKKEGKYIVNYYSWNPVNDKDINKKVTYICVTEEEEFEEPKETVSPSQEPSQSEEGDSKETEGSEGGN